MQTSIRLYYAVVSTDEFVESVVQIDWFSTPKPRIPIALTKLSNLHTIDDRQHHEILVRCGSAYTDFPTEISAFVWYIFTYKPSTSNGTKFPITIYINSLFHSSPRKNLVFSLIRFSFVIISLYKCKPHEIQNSGENKWTDYSKKVEMHNVSEPETKLDWLKLITTTSKQAESRWDYRLFRLGWMNSEASMFQRAVVFSLKKKWNF